MSARRKRFAIVGAAALIVLAAALGVSFTADTGAVNVTASTGHVSSLVTIAGSSLPSGVADWQISGTSSSTSPTLANIAAGQNGYVSASGDLAMINLDTADATNGPTSTEELISVYLTNAGSYGTATPTYALPVELYCGTASGSPAAVSSWTLDAGGATFVTNTTPMVSWTVSTGTAKYCEVSLGGALSSGSATYEGSLYTQSTSSGSNSPQFYITAEQTGGQS